MKTQKTQTEAQFAKFFQPIIAALRELGGSGRPSEVKSWILGHQKLSDDYLALLNKTGETKFSNQVDWARFYLVKSGFLDASTRGVWSLTDKGRAANIDNQFATEILRTVQTRLRELAAPDSVKPDPQKYLDVESFETASGDYKAKLLATIKLLPPHGFERLCQRLLREAGFEEVHVTGRTGDGGIDGHGVLQINPFVSFRVLFQCKRVAGTVGAEKVRDFRGAMAGRTDKGIILTTGTFTAAAVSESSRDGVPPIELVDGDSLVMLFEQLELGLQPKRSFDLDDTFFDQFR